MSREGSSPRGGREHDRGLPVAPPVAERTHEDQFGRLIDISISEVALMWILHQRTLLSEPQTKPLSQQILEFRAAAFAAIMQNSRAPPDIREAHLWLIFLKGLLTARTHPQEQMIDAIRSIKERVERQVIPGQGGAAESNRATGSGPAGDAETLTHIAEALIKVPG